MAPRVCELCVKKLELRRELAFLFNFCLTEEKRNHGHIRTSIDIFKQDGGRSIRCPVCTH
jgi:hypothetical protein